MATEAMREIVGNLIGDMQFRRTFLENPDNIISNYSLNAEESYKLRSVGEGDILGLCEELDDTVMAASYLVKVR